MCPSGWAADETTPMQWLFSLQQTAYPHIAFTAAHRATRPCKRMHLTDARKNRKCYIFNKDTFERSFLTLQMRRPNLPDSWSLSQAAPVRCIPQYQHRSAHWCLLRTQLVISAFTCTQIQQKSNICPETFMIMRTIRNSSSGHMHDKEL